MENTEEIIKENDTKDMFGITLCCPKCWGMWTETVAIKINLKAEFDCCDAWHGSVELDADFNDIEIYCPYCGQPYLRE